MIESGRATGLPAERVAALFAVDPVGLGGVSLRAAAGAARDRWLERLAALLPEGTTRTRVPLGIDDNRLLGGLDLAATLRAGRPVAERGLLAASDGGIVLLAMAERLDGGVAARVAAVVDTQEVAAERQGTGVRGRCRVGVVALDEGIGDDERPPSRLLERLAFHLELDPGLAHDDSTREAVAEARALFPSVTVDDATIERLCAAASALGVDSVRAPLLACRAARAAAALDGRGQVQLCDAALAAALVFAPRATRLPAAEEPQPGASEAVPRESSLQDREPDGAPPPASPPTTEPAPQRARDDAADDAADNGSPSTTAGEPVLEAARAAVPPGLLAMLAAGATAARRAPAGQGAGAAQTGSRRGRPVGARRGEPRGGARMNLIETLRAAAPWQLLRRRESAGSAALGHSQVLVRRLDIHVWRFRQRSETTTVFVVDASGSAALHRLAEAKGAVELLLADCYVRRDSVALIAFRGSGAEVLLPPTRSLVRAKRSLAGLPGGGGTPLAAGLAAARSLVDGVRRRGATPLVVLLTDGRANIAVDGSPGRARAGADALAAARQLRSDGVASVLLDTSPQPQQTARDLASAMGARYVPLPHAGAFALSQAVRATRSAASG